MPKQIAITVRRNSSGKHVRATRSSSGGIRRRATSNTRMIASALPSAGNKSAADPPAPASIGTSNTITMIARS